LLTPKNAIPQSREINNAAAKISRNTHTIKSRKANGVRKNSFPSFHFVASFVTLGFKLVSFQGRKLFPVLGIPREASKCSAIQRKYVGKFCVNIFYSAFCCSVAIKF